MKTKEFIDRDDRIKSKATKNYRPPSGEGITARRDSSICRRKKSVFHTRKAEKAVLCTTAFSFSDKNPIKI
ncbi:MAG TPA: hypothetical protein DDY70_03555 [Clostridiales bacterium]|nr:hypothetical protein [Clostridiales bacterium]